MDRRKFLRAGSSLALLPLLPWSKESKSPPTVGHQPPYWEYPPQDMIWVEHLGRWIPKQWAHDAVLVGQNIALKLADEICSCDSMPKLKKCEVFYDICAWRNLEHNWIGYIETVDGGKSWGTEWSYSLWSYSSAYSKPEIKTTKIMMMGCDKPIPYPHKSEWDGLKDYGNTIAQLVNHQMKG